MNTFNLRLDLDKAPTLPLWVTIRQGDKNGTTISASIYDHGTLLAGSYSARIAFQLPDGEHYYRKDATFSSGVATVTIDETEAASVTGNTVGYFEILSGSTVIASTANFGIHVLQSATEGMTPGENYDTAIQDAIDGLNEAVAELPDTVEDILEEHPEWTTTVQDGSISVPKLASDVRSSLSGAILAAIGGTLVTAHDAAAVPPNALALFGRSTQSGTPTPSAPVAITSITSATLTTVGKNLMPEPAIGTTATGGNVEAKYVGDGWWHVSGQSNATASTNIVLAGGSSATLYPGSASFQLLLETSGTPLVTDKVRLQVYGVKTGGSTSNNSYNSSGTYSITNITSRLARISVNLSASSSGTSVDGYIRITLVAGGTAPTAYVPYDPSSSTLAIDLQGHELRSLPDGTHDELRIDAAGNVTLVQRVYEWQMKDFYDKGWLKSVSATNGYYVSCSQITPVPATSTQTGHHDCILSNMATAVATTSIYFSTTNSCYLDSALNFNLDGSIVGTTLSNFKTWLSTSSITLVGPLATPQEISLGAVTMPDLPSPDLTAWAAQGAELAVTYQRDATLVIAGIYAQLAPVDGPTATSNHGVGTYLMLGGTLCKVTTAIAAGETIALGTNVVATTVMTEILALTA